MNEVDQHLMDLIADGDEDGRHHRALAVVHQATTCQALRAAFPEHCLQHIWGGGAALQYAVGGTAHRVQELSSHGGRVGDAGVDCIQ